MCHILQTSMQDFRGISWARQRCGQKDPPPLSCGPIAGLSKPACQSLCLENRSVRSAGPCSGLAHRTQGSCRGTGQMGKAKVATFSTVWFHIVISCSPENESEWKPLFFVWARVPSWSARPSSDFKFPASGGPGLAERSPLSVTPHPATNAILPVLFAAAVATA